MERAFFEKLLYEEESATLDFKSAQYRFAKATDDEKSELLKDILGFANAWRRSEAYILIGVEEVRGGPHNVVGIRPTDHLDDHSLQQFVHNLTNRNVLFHYEAFTFEDKHVGIIRIEQQPRPFYLKRDYGKLKKEQVYVRRGSSTDRTQPASLEEVARMGQTAEPESAELVVEFADPDSDSTLGRAVSWDAEFCVTPPSDSIPDLTVPSQPALVHGIDLSACFVDPFNRPNPDYFRQLAEYESARRMFHLIRLVVTNTGRVAAKNVQCELAVATNIGVWVIHSSDWPDAPKRRSSMRDLRALESIGPAFRQTAGGVTITKKDKRYLIEMECGDLQPGRRVRSAEFYVGKGETGEVELAGHIYADNLPQPTEFTLTISAKVSSTSLTVNDLRNLPEPPT